MPPQLIRQLEIELQRQALITLLILIVVFAIVMYVLYWVIRAAIRDGIRDSGALDALRRRTSDPNAGELPDFAATNPRRAWDK